jgi:hypothetical protein
MCVALKETILLGCAFIRGTCTAKLGKSHLCVGCQRSLHKNKTCSCSVWHAALFNIFLTLFSISVAERQREESRKQQKLGKFGKDPGVETSFLPDRYGDCASLNCCTS